MHHNTFRYWPSLFFSVILALTLCVAIPTFDVVNAQEAATSQTTKKNTPAASKKKTAKKNTKKATAAAIHGTIASQLERGLAAADPNQPALPIVVTAPEQAWAGEAFHIQLSGSGLASATFQWRGKTLTVDAGHNGQQADTCEVLLAVPLNDKTRTYPLVVTVSQNGITRTLKATVPVGSRLYPVQKLTVAQKYVTPDPSVQERIQRDRETMKATLQRVSQHKYWTVPFLRPVPGRVTSVFGLRRVFNGQPRNPHQGIDFSAKEGDPIAAIEAGTVALVADQYFGGNTVVVDHGLGVFSIYLHMSAFNVQEGQRVEKGDTIGFIGSTGRSTGPHLHLSGSVLSTSINMGPFIKDF